MAKKKSESSSSSSLSNIKLPSSLQGAFGLIVIGFIACLVWTKLIAPQVTVTTQTVTEQLMKCEELVTAKLQYTGLVTYQEGNITLIDKKAYTMQYDATVSAGIDLSQAKVDVEDGVISIDLPKSTLKSIVIDPDTIQFRDQEYALFNWQNRSDTVEALKIAEDDAKKKVDENDLLTQADEQARSAVEALFSILTGENGYTLKITTEGEATAETEATTAEATTAEATATESGEATSEAAAE